MGAQFIALKSLSKSYGRHPAVRDMSIVIPRGGIVGLLGPNGAGKSTTIAMLTGLLTPSSGGILWDSFGPVTLVELAGVAAHPFTWVALLFAVVAAAARLYAILLNRVSRVFDAEVERVLARF